MPKRKANVAGIKAAFSRQAERAEASAQTAAWQPVEVAVTGWCAVPDNYLQESTAKFNDYMDKRDQIAKIAARSKERDSTDQTRVASWQAHAAYCVQQLAMWPGSGVVLQQVQQEALLHIIVNDDLHLDPTISSQAYSLLLQNLMQHPPVVLTAAGSGQAEPPVLQCADRSGLCWNIFSQPSKPLLPEAAAPFPMLQQLVRNAAQLVQQHAMRSSRSATSSTRSGSGGGSSNQPSGFQGQALLLLYVVQLLQADLLVRQAAFERYMALSQSLDNEAQKAEAESRAATVLQHSLLYRVIENDSVGGDSWRHISGSNKGRHQLVRDLLLLVSSTGDDAAASTPPAPAATQRPPAPTSAAAVTPDGGDTEMDDANEAGAGEPGIDVCTAVPVSSQELVQAARLLLLLLLQLYSSCEEAGVYGRGGDGRHHMQRLQGGAGQPNDRFELDDVIMTAIGSCGHVATYALPELEQQSRLQRLLAALPPVHRARLLCLMVVSVINNRVMDPESEGKVALSAHNLELQGLKEYLCDRGRGYAGFRQPSVVQIVQAVEARLEWAAKEMFGGKQLFVLLMANLINAAAATLANAPGPDIQALAAAASHILQHVLDKGRAALVADLVRAAPSETLLALTAAKQQLSMFADEPTT